MRRQSISYEHENSDSSPGQLNMRSDKEDDDEDDDEADGVAASPSQKWALLERSSECAFTSTDLHIKLFNFYVRTHCIIYLYL